jgi:hypothetical protein
VRVMNGARRPLTAQPTLDRVARDDEAPDRRTGVESSKLNGLLDGPPRVLVRSHLARAAVHRGEHVGNLARSERGVTVGPVTPVRKGHDAIPGWEARVTRLLAPGPLIVPRPWVLDVSHARAFTR